MKIMIAALIATGATSPAFAQSSPYQGSPTPTLSPSQLPSPEAGTRSADYLSRSSLETPTMRRQKRERAIALREEALQLQAQDGGTLSKNHQLYIQRKSAEILAYSNQTPPGLLQPAR
ncbi:hypothetical protein [Sphingomonas faeni]|uniref:hypothetical protein n=1 Tax=Sphingomonas faeni TaxID=185950 RepID=UPI00334E7D33